MSRLVYRVDCIAYIHKSGTPYEHKKPQTVARFALEGDANDWAFRMAERLHRTDDRYVYILDVYKGRQKVYRAG